MSIDTRLSRQRLYELITQYIQARPLPTTEEEIEKNMADMQLLADFILFTGKHK